MFYSAKYVLSLSDSRLDVLIVTKGYKPSSVHLDRCYDDEVHDEAEAH